MTPSRAEADLAETRVTASGKETFTVPRPVHSLNGCQVPLRNLCKICAKLVLNVAAGERPVQPSSWEATGRCHHSHSALGCVVRGIWKRHMPCGSRVPVGGQDLVDCLPQELVDGVQFAFYTQKPNKETKPSNY